MKKYLPFLAFFLFYIGASAQTTLPMEDEYILTVSDCDSLIITAGSYIGPDLYTTWLTFPNTDSRTALVNPDYFGQLWDVDGGCELRFYDGFEDSAQLLGAYNTVDYPNGFMLNIEVEFLRIEFDISEDSSGDGFEMALFCNDALAGLPSAKFKPELTEDWYYDEELNMNVLRACRNDSFNIALDPVYLNPQAENQNVDSILVKWSMGDFAFKRGEGLTQINHTYTDGNGYLVTVYSQDSLGAESYLKFLVRNSPEPEFELDEDLSFCQNEPTQITGGMDGDEVVGATAQFGGTSISEFYGTELYLPDGSGENYTTSVEVSGFPEGATISSGSDLLALCVNIEHSYLGDLEMKLTCPDGTDVNIFNSFTGDGLFSGGFGGGGTYLGDANDGYMPEPGIGFDYCFADNAAWGTLAEEYVAENTVPVSTFQPGNAMAPGTYKPEGNYESFVGCPLNGEWTLVTRDNLGVDDGYIFDWSLGFNEDAGSGFYQNGLVAASWENNDWITAVNAGFIEVTPTNDAPSNLTFTITDANGCTFSHDLTVQVADTLNAIEEPVICDLSYQVNWPNTEGSLQFVSGPSSDVSIAESGNHFEVQVPEIGDYTFAFNYFDCGISPEAQLTFLDPSNPACLTAIDEVDIDDDVVLAPNPTENFVNLQFELSKAMNVQIKIITIDGKVVSEQEMQLSGRSQNVRIDLEKLESGTYLVTLQGDSFKTSKVLIKQ